MAELLIGCFAVYRLALLLHLEAGPFGVFEKWRSWLENNTWQWNPTVDGALLRAVRELFECYWCLSLWLALPVAALLFWGDWRLAILAWLGLSGGAILIKEVSNGKE